MLLQVKPTITTAKETNELNEVNFHINNVCLTIYGSWQSDILTEVIFCSPQFVSFTDVDNRYGPKCLIHPDDVAQLTKCLDAIQNNQSTTFHFRIITSYGQIKNISGAGPFEWEAKENFTESLIAAEAARALENQALQKEHQQQAQMLYSYQHLEYIYTTGIWYINSSTHQVYYSDNVYRIYELQPQSLNAHYNTFTAFIHPEDIVAVTDSFDKAYQNMVPLCLEYRIVLKDGQQKYISIATTWSFNAKGESVLHGMVEDITSKKVAADEMQLLKQELALKDALLLQTEAATLTANWNLNLTTRKIVYSDVIYRIYGIRPTAIVITLQALENYIHPDDKGAVMEATRQMLYEHVVTELQYRIIRPDGKTRYLKQGGKVIINNNNEMLIIGYTTDVTEAYLLEHKKKEADDKFATQRQAAHFTEEALGTGRLLIDTTTGETDASDGMYHLLGLKPGLIKISQKILQHYLHPDDQKAFAKKINAALEATPDDAPAVPSIFRVIRKGKPTFLKTHTALLPLNDRYQLLVVIQDVTAQHLLQQQLTAEAAMGQKVIDASMDAILITDVQNYIVQWNKQAEERYGVKRDKAIGQNLYDLLPQLRAPHILSYNQRALRGEVMYQQNEKSTGSGGYYNLLLVPLKNEQAQVTGLLTIVHDTTKEFDLYQQLTHRLQFIEKLLEASVDRIIVLDNNMNYQYWNNRAAGYYGMDKKSVVGKNILEIFPSLINDPSYLHFKTALKGEMVYLKPDFNESSKDYFETYLIPIADENKQVSGVLWITHDLSKEYKLRLQE